MLCRPGFSARREIFEWDVWQMDPAFARHDVSVTLGRNRQL